MSIFDWFNDIFSPSPSVNIDGAPMVGNSGLDIHGHPFGVTDTFESHGFDTDLFNSTSSGSMFDSVGSDSMFD